MASNLELAEMVVRQYQTAIEQLKLPARGA